MNFLNSIFNIKKYECAGVDGLIVKLQAQAVREGKISREYLGIPIVVKDTKGAGGGASGGEEKVLVNEVKRMGLLIDRYVDLELRIGDTLVIYI